MNSYRVQLATGTMAAAMAANSPIFGFRWTHATKIARVREIHVGLESLGTGFTAGVGSFAVWKATAWTADDSGGTAPTLGEDGQMVSSAGAASAGLRIATTAALTPGTRTLDGQTHGLLAFTISAAANTVFQVVGSPPLLLTEASQLMPPKPPLSPPPFHLVTNEGFLIHATVPATGTWTGRIRVVWDE